MTKTATRFLVIAAATFAASSACDKVPLTAPVASTISVSALSTALPPGGSTEVIAVVTEEAGTPVQNGTLVRFSTTSGRVDPAEATTRDGLARTTFTAGSTAGTAKITATSGAAQGGDPDNTVEITVG
jgi:hypothetical protein